MIEIGYAQEIINPALDRPVYLAGFGQNRRAKSIHDDLFARALALRSGSTTIVLCALDLIGFFRPHAMEVGWRVNEITPHTLVIVASTHTHHGPDTMGLWGPNDKTCGVDPQYLTMLLEKTTHVILASLAKMQTAKIKYTSIQVPGVAKNARDPAIVDQELTLVQFCNHESNQPLATLFIFPCHPEVLEDQNPHITSDYPGVLRREVEKVTAAPCIFFSGALGGMMTPDVKDHSFEDAEKMGKKLAEEGLHKLAKTANQDVSGFNFSTSQIHVKMTNPLFKLAIKRGLLPDPRDRKGIVTTEVNLIKINGLWLATVPGELLPRLGLAMKSVMGRAGGEVTGIIGLANDEVGYILPAEDFHYPLNPFRPGKHYEETMSLSKDIGTIIVNTIRELL